MGRFVIVGAGIGGLVTALMLGRAGHEVVVCERDASPVPADADEMWSSWARPGTPQARLGHTFLAGFRRMLEERLPDVVQDVFSAGAQRWDVASEMPGDERRGEDTELLLIMARRPVMEGVLRRAAEAESTVDIRSGCQVLGLTAEPAKSGAPTVTGVGIKGHGSIAADTVVVAGGRTLPIGRWFREIGATAPPEQSEGCGAACYTRYFRLRERPGDNDAVTRQLTFHHERGLVVGELIGADSRTFATELSVPIADQEFHRLREPAVWTAATNAVDQWREWLDPERSQPISPAIEIMGQERNVIRTFADENGPLALGVHVIGDARCQTDSLFAWGCGNAMTTAAALVDALTEHPNDKHAQALALEQHVGPELAGRFSHSRARNRATRAAALGEPPDQTTTALVDNVLYPASKHDAEVYRAVTRWESQLDPADALDKNTAIAKRARLVSHPPTDDDPFPTREQLLSVIASAT
jgi:2-polyprenyl-6-methoxyphenol hydroxylase-like FAD-dependent oxidoreductase